MWPDAGTLAVRPDRKEVIRAAAVCSWSGRKGGSYMKKGISYWSFADGSLADNLKLARDAGFDGVELAINDTGEIHLESTKEDMAKVKALMEQNGLSTYSVANTLSWTYLFTSSCEESRKKAIEVLKKQIQVASWLDCDTVLVVPGAVGVDFLPVEEVVDYDIAYERSFTAIDSVKDFAKDHGVAIGVENVWNKFLLSPLEMRDFIDKFDSDYVGAYFDVGNVLYSGYPDQWIRILGKRIKKVHFKDFRRSVGTIDGFVDLLAGDVDYPAVIQALKDVGYDGWVTGEMIPPYQRYPDQILYNTSKSMDRILSGR